MDGKSNEKLCVFSFSTGCSSENEYAPIPLTDARITSAVKASEAREDLLDSTLLSGANLQYHSNCYVSYTSKNHIQRYKKRRSIETAASSSNIPCKSTRSSVPLFDFKTKCFICALPCNVEVNKIHSDRWKKNKAFLCKTADRGKGVLTFKEVILLRARERGDVLVDEVRIRTLRVQLLISTDVMHVIMKNVCNLLKI